MKRGGIPSFPSPQERFRTRRRMIEEYQERGREGEARFGPMHYISRWCVRVQWSLSGRGDAEPAETAKHTWYVQPSCSPTLRVRSLASRPSPTRSQRERDTWRTRYRRPHTYAHSRGQEKRVHRDWPFPLHRGAGRFRTASRNGLLPWLNAP